MTTERKYTSPAVEDRSIGTSVRRGLACKCPQCGEGRMFGRFLKVNPTCDSCGLAIDGHRADDMPPYITIMIVGHIVVPLMLLAERTTSWSMTTHFIIWPLLTIALAMAFMQPVKGALIGYQWAMKMHGFDPENAPSTPGATQKAPA